VLLVLGGFLWQAEGTASLHLGVSGSVAVTVTKPLTATEPRSSGGLGDRTHLSGNPSNRHSYAEGLNSSGGSVKIQFAEEEERIRDASWLVRADRIDDGPILAIAKRGSGRNRSQTSNYRILIFGMVGN